uniref:Rhodopsin domain-containing protein n=1 Tax=Talaromyces marneffei PM1 TaxID=1077442 RepID=A0A093UZX3_TALMA
MSTSEPHVFPLGHETKHAITASLVLMGVAISLLFTRFYTRRHLIDAVQSSDYMVLLASMFAVTFVGIFIAGGFLAFINVDLQQLEADKHVSRHIWRGTPFYNASMVTAKASIIIQYFHVFPTKKMRIFCWIMVVVIAIHGTWVILSAFLNCIPVAHFWDPAVPGHCLAYKPLWYSNAALNIMTDMTILFMPIPALVPLDLPLRQKVACCCIFALGGFVCITSICRLLSLKTLFNSHDRSYHNLAVLMWSAIECNTGVICACLPTLRPALTRLWPALASIFVPGHRRGRSSSDTITSFYGRSDESAAIPIVHETLISPRELDSNRGSVATAKPGSSAGGSSMQQAPPNVRMIPTPGNGFAQDLARKGSFFEQQQRPNSYV